LRRFSAFPLPVSGKKTAYIAPLSVVDLSDLQPFEGATNRTAVLICQNSVKPVSYPVPYQIWSKKKQQTISESEALPTVLSKVQLTDLVANPVSLKSETSPWLTVPGVALDGVKRC